MKKYLIVVFAALLFIPSVSFGAFDVSLKYGSKGDAVSELQDFLQDQSFLTTAPNGRFGLATLKAVKAFQTANKLSPDGFFGKSSRAKANELLQADLSSSDNAEQQELATPTTGLIAGCTTATGFSILTGHPCTSTSSLPAGCVSITGFSSTTGLACDGSVPRPVTVVPSPTTSSDPVSTPIIPSQRTIKVDAGGVWNEQNKIVLTKNDPVPNNMSDFLYNIFTRPDLVINDPHYYAPLNGILVQIQGYLPSDKVDVTLKDGDTAIPILTTQESSNSGKKYLMNTYAIPLVAKTYNMSVTINNITKDYTISVNSNSYNSDLSQKGNVSINGSDFYLNN